MEKKEVQIKDILRAEAELRKIMAAHDAILEEKMFKLITLSYSNAIKDIDKRGCAKIAGIENPRLDYFLRSMFYFIFKKLTRGERQKAYSLLEELRLVVLKMQ